MNPKTIIAIVAATLAAGTAVAQSENNKDHDMPPHQVTRAEVIADLEIYIQSGLRDIEMRDPPNLSDRNHQTARARYEELRRSPAFAARVQQIAQQRGEAVRVN